jgi:hypothetical protein
MRTNFVTIVAIALLVSTCLFCACISQKTDNLTSVLNSTPQPIPPVTITEPQQSAYISFEEAQGHLGEYLDTNPKTNPDGAKSYQRTPGNISIRFVQGIKFDTSGNAQVWTFGIQTDNATELRAYDRSGWTIIPLNETFSSREIIVDQIVSPTALFEKNREAIFRASVSDNELRKMELVDGMYSVTIGQPPRIMKFDATTGAPIEPNA